MKITKLNFKTTAETLQLGILLSNSTSSLFSPPDLVVENSLVIARMSPATEVVRTFMPGNRSSRKTTKTQLLGTIRNKPLYREVVENMDSPRRSRNRAACQRCQKRKIRCDGSLPQCSACVKANVTCVNEGKQEVNRT